MTNELLLQPQKPVTFKRQALNCVVAVGREELFGIKHIKLSGSKGSCLDTQTSSVELYCYCFWKMK